MIAELKAILYMQRYGGPELFMLLVTFILLPVLYVFFLKRLARKTRNASIAGIWLCGLVIAYGDVYMNAREAERLCREEAGLHVYSRIRADGMLGLHGLSEWARYGFTYIENESPGKRYMYRESLIDGKVVREEVSAFRSRYEYVSKNIPLDSPVLKRLYAIQDRETGEVVGEIVGFSFYPGWLDRRALGLVGLSWSPPLCDADFIPKPQFGQLRITDLIKSVVVAD